MPTTHQQEADSEISALFHHWLAKEIEVQTLADARADESLIEAASDEAIDAIAEISPIIATSAAGFAMKAFIAHCMGGGDERCVSPVFGLYVTQYDVDDICTGNAIAGSMLADAARLVPAIAVLLKTPRQIDAANAAALNLQAAE